MGRLLNAYEWPIADHPGFGMGLRWVHRVPRPAVRGVTAISGTFQLTSRPHDGKINPRRSQVRETWGAGVAQWQSN